MLHIIWVWPYRHIYIIKSKCCEPFVDNKSIPSINDWKRSWSHLFYRIICWLLRCPKTCRILRFQSCCCPFCWRKFWTITIKKLVNIPPRNILFKIFRNSTYVIFMILREVPWESSKSHWRRFITWWHMHVILRELKIRREIEFEAKMIRILSSLRIFEPKKVSSYGILTRDQ